MDWMAVSSYGSGTKSSGVVRILKDLDCDITDRHVLVVEDIVDSGLTLSWLVRNLQSRGPASLQVCALLRKPGAARVDVDVAYTGFDIGDAFVIGYGLDYAERYRNLPFIGTLAPHVYGGAAKRPVQGTGAGSGGEARGEHDCDDEIRSRVANVAEAAAIRRRASCVSAVAGAVYRQLFAVYTRRAERKSCAWALGRIGSPAGGRRDLRLVRRGRPATGAAVHRWI